MQLRFNSVSEPDVPGQKWKKLFDTYWPSYQTWLKSKKKGYVPSLRTSQAALKKYMPKMWPTYQALCKLVNADSSAARFLTGFQPPAYISACSQAVINKSTVQLVRNYDYHPNLMEGTLLLSSWNGKKVIATSDCLIGVVDGMNEDGLAVSLTFGGRKVVGVGFGIPFILRYVLEFCTNVEEAVSTLVAIPSHMSYNVTVVDRSGNFKTILVSPDREAIITDAPFTTNHQDTIDWPENSSFTRTLEHSYFLEKLLSEENLSAKKMSDAFLQPPMYNTLFEQGFGTLYTAVYKPLEGTVRLRWPQDEMLVSFDDFKEQVKHIKFNQNSHLPEFGKENQYLTDKKLTHSATKKTEDVGSKKSLYPLSQQNEELKKYGQKKAKNGEVSWKLLVAYWSKLRQKHWQKRQK